MLRPNIFLPFILLMQCFADIQSHEDQGDRANCDKLVDLNSRWNRVHPVTYQPMSEHDKELLVEISKERSDPHHILSIPEINGATGANVIQGDIMLTRKNIAVIEERLREEENTDNRSKRAASMILQTNWEGPIPFMIDSAYDKNKREMIETAMRTIEENTCVDFKEDTGPGLKLDITGLGGKICQSYIGDVRTDVKQEQGTNQTVWLAAGCLKMNIIQHELIHALGFGHTQMRSDRDEYMKVIPEKILDMRQFQMIDPKEFNNHSIPYEYNSVMHYPSTDFSIDNATPVLIPWNEDYIASVGGTHGPTFNDWKGINIRYNCKDKCNATINCLNNGYPHPRECSRCACPIFYAGPNCEQEVNATSLQMGEAKHFTFSTTHDPAKTQFSAWNMEEFSQFNKELHVIKAPEGQRIRITLNNIKPREQFSCVRECHWMAVEIVDGDMSLVGKRFCCTNTTGKTFLSETNVIGYQVYARPGIDFSSDVTFTIEPNENPETEGPPTSEPGSGNEATTPYEAEETTTSIDMETSSSDETMIPDATTLEPQTTDSGATDNTQTSVSETEELHTTINSTEGSTQTSDPEEEIVSESSTLSTGEHQTTHSGIRATRTEQPYTVESTDSPLTTTETSTGKNISDRFNSINTLLIEIRGLLDRISNNIHW